MISNKFLSVVSVFFGLVVNNSNAATACVYNQETNTFEPKECAIGIADNPLLPKPKKELAQPTAVASEKNSIDSNEKRSVVSVNTNPETSQPAAVAVQSWDLVLGHSISQDLKAWADKAGWVVIWNISKDWSVPANTRFVGDFEVAAGDVIKTLSANGALVRAQFFEGNKTVVVVGPGVTE